MWKILFKTYPHVKHKIFENHGKHYSNNHILLSKIVKFNICKISNKTNCDYCFFFLPKTTIIIKNKTKKSW